MALDSDKQHARELLRQLEGSRDICPKVRDWQRRLAKALRRYLFSGAAHPFLIPEDQW